MHTRTHQCIRMSSHTYVHTHVHIYTAPWASAVCVCLPRVHTSQEHTWICEFVHTPKMCWILAHTHIPIYPHENSHTHTCTYTLHFGRQQCVSLACTISRYTCKYAISRTHRWKHTCTCTHAQEYCTHTHTHVYMHTHAYPNFLHTHTYLWIWKFVQALKIFLYI